MMQDSNYYFVRLLSRGMDFLFIALIVEFAHSVNSEFQSNPLGWFILYNCLVILFNGRTIGKYSFSLTVKTRQEGIRKIVTLIAREFLIIVLLPILVLNFIFVASLPLHDRLIGTKVTRHEF